MIPPLHRALTVLRRVFVDDAGRKLLALLFALVLFDLLDAKVQATDRLLLQIAYVDDKELAQLAEAPERVNKLLVVQRADPAAPLVVSSRPRPDTLTLLLHAPRDAIDRVKSRRHTFVMRLQREGAIDPGVDEIGGIDALRRELGAAAKVEIDPPVRLRVEREERHLLAIAAEDIALRGRPAPGFDRSHRTTQVRPPTVTLVGPRSDVDAARQRGEELFEEVLLDDTSSQVTQEVGLSAGWSDRIRLEDGNGKVLRSIRVTIEFKRRMAPVPEADGGICELPVRAVENDELLRRDDAVRSFAAGWSLRFPQWPDGVPRRRVQFSVPESSNSDRAMTRVMLELARDNVELVVRAHDLAGVDRGTLDVHIVTFPDFPPEFEVAFAPGEPKVVEAQWEPPAPGAAASRTEDEEGDGG